MSSKKIYLKIDVPIFVSEGKAACVDADPEMFFPIESEDHNGKPVASYTDAKTAKEICNSCDLKARCLDYALSSYDIGIWGGTTDQQRISLRRGLTMRPLNTKNDRW